MSDKICVIGEGNWGTAIAILLADNGFHVNLWCHNPEIAHSINNNHINNVYLPNLKLSEKIYGVSDFSEAFKDVKIIFEAIPVKFLRSVLQKAKPYASEEQTWAILSKGIEQKTCFLPTEIIDDVFSIKTKKAIISGPSFAHDLIKKQLTVVDLASSDNQVASELNKILENKYFKINFCNDMIGIQICGALKNIVALVIGIAEGLGYSDNTKAFIFTKGIEQILLLVDALGGNPKTVFGLCGIGDLVLTSFGKHSKNFHLGVEIGKGKKIEDILKTPDSIPEGINTIQSIHHLILKNNIKLSFFDGIYNVIFHDKNFNEMIVDNC